MSKREADKLAKLIRKNVGKTTGKQSDRSARYDDTLRRKPADLDDETRRFFKDMKRREF